MYKLIGLLLTGFIFMRVIQPEYKVDNEYLGVLIIVVGLLLSYELEDIKKKLK